jgi:hypothetical protein
MESAHGANNALGSRFVIHEPKRVRAARVQGSHEVVIHVHEHDFVIGLGPQLGQKAPSNVARAKLNDNG